MRLARPPKIDTLKSPPVVGETYRVPSVRRGEVFVPVFGQPHTDVELGNTILHFHVDIRFISDEDAKEVRLRMAEYAVHHFTRKFLLPAISGSANEVIKHREMKCLRQGPDYQGWKTDEEGNPKCLIVGTLAQTGLIEDQCEDKSVTKCGKCPHRGTPLGHQPVIDDTVVCPAHLLKWDKATGKLIRKTKKVNGEYVYAEERAC